MKSYCICLLLFLLCIPSLSAQDSPFWNGLSSGKYAVGVRDTVLLNAGEVYKFRRYSGAKPFFVSIWYPAVDDPSKPYLKYDQYTAFNHSKDLHAIISALRYRYRKILIKDAVCKDIKEKEAIKYKPAQKKILAEILAAPVNAKRNLLPVNVSLPLIFYHHGAQSSPFDNVLFCEYMASHGYTVISSNFLWPIDGKPHLGNSDQLNDIIFLLKHMKELSGFETPDIIAAGHSWGGQALILYDTLKNKPFKKIIAFHTTLEDKPVNQAIKMWPGLMAALQTKSDLMSTPTFLFAPQYRIKDGFDYLPYRENKATPYTFITVNTDFISHDGFVLLGNLRTPFADKYKLNDVAELKTQDQFYKQIILLSKSIIEDSITDKDQSLFSDKFTLQIVNR